MNRRTGTDHKAFKPTAVGVQRSPVACVLWSGLSIALVLALALIVTQNANAASVTDDPVAEPASKKGSTGPSFGSSEERWEYLREQLFGTREIQSGTGLIRVEAAGRAFDAARVPVTLRSSLSSLKEGYIQKVYLIVDNNPLPVAATFSFEPNNGWDTIDTELRINEYSHMRVLAETNLGELHMDKLFIKAVGGCSAPPSSYERSDANLLGNIRGGVEQLLNPKVPAVARIRLIHPNASGMQFDQMTRTYIQPHYIHTMIAEFDGKPLFKVDTNFSLSQDPVLGFNFKPQKAGKLTLIAVDSKDQHFQKSWSLKASEVN